MAIIGSGDIAKALNDREGFIFFAAGVSNSSEKNEAEYERERGRLFDTIQTANQSNVTLVYFGSISRFHSMTRYTIHKYEMEQLIRTYCNNYTVIRIGNISWGTNPNTFINFIRNKKAAGQFVQVKDEWKYMIDKDELRFVTDNLPRIGKNEISVFGQMKKVKDCL
jgi:nucleoside-diphosphate-sugar epimerase